MAVPAAAVTAAVPDHDLPDHLTVPASDLPANLVPASDLPDTVPTMTIRPDAAVREMPKIGPLPGNLSLNPKIAPVVPRGEPRPFAPGEYLENPDGSWSSEISVTVTDPRLNAGKPTNIPSLWLVGNAPGTGITDSMTDMQGGKAVRVPEDQAVEYAIKSGLKFPSYATPEEADAASAKREELWQGLGPRDAGKIEPLWERPPPSNFPEDDPGRYYGMLPFSEDLNTHEKLWGVEQSEIVRSLARGVRDIGERISGPLTPDKMHGLNADEQGAFLTMGGMPKATTKMFAPTGKAAEEALAASQKAAMDKAALETANQIRTSNQGQQIVAKRMNEDIAGGSAMVRPPVEHGPPPAAGGPPTLQLPTTPADNVVANLDRMREGGKPATLVDVGGPNTRGLAGSVARKPGVGQSVLRSSMEERDKEAGARATADVKRYLTAGPSAYRTTRDLIAQRSAQGDPLYRKAFEGGSLAPLHDQFQAAWVDAGRAAKEAADAVVVAKSQLNAALAKDPVTQGNVYSASAANDAIRAAKRNLRAAEEAQEHAEAAKQKTLDMLHVAQEDIANDAPGAVWNPRIQEFLDLPDIRKGLRRGYHIQRNDAVADGVPFNPREYALTEDGEVIRVPNMRTLNVAKKGLDAMISDERDEYGRLSEFGTSLDKVRRSFLAEIDRINPDYAAARANWAGHSAALDALKWGQNIRRLPPEQIAEEFAHMSPSEQEFARHGLADTVLERIGKTNFSGDEAKAVINNQWTQDQLQPLFRSQEDFTRYIEAVGHERQMKETMSKVLAGSQTAERVAEDNSRDISTAGHAAVGAFHALQGNFRGALGSAWRAYRDFGLRPDEALTEAIARTLTDTGPGPNVVNGKLKFPPPPAPPINAPSGPIYPRE